MTTTSTTPAPTTNRRGLQWPALIIGMLVLNMGVCAVTIVAAVRTNPPVEPDYYQRALEWDQHRPDAAPSDPARAGSSRDGRDGGRDP